MEDKILIGIAVFAGLLIIGFLRDRSFQTGRLAGAREAVHDLSRACSYHYEFKDQPLPKKVDEALTYMTDGLKRGKGTKGKLYLFLLGAGMLGDAMGEAASRRGFDAGRASCADASEADTRLDMTEHEIRTLAYLADVGFHHVIEGGRASNFRDAADAEAASNAVHILESHAPSIEGMEDAYRDASWYRQTSIWDKWPNNRG